MKKQNGQRGFTLAEVLMTLLIIGVVAGLTVPNLIANSQKEANRSSFKKAISVLNQAVEKSYLEFQAYPKCFYWDKNPYGAAQCKGYNAAGDCTGYTMAGTDAPLPKDYNGVFSQCTPLFTNIKDNMSVTKFCQSNGFANGCMPEYKGNDDVQKAGYGDDVDDKDYAAAKATSGCGGYRGPALKQKMAVVTTDGMIFFPYTSNYASIIGVDVNGMKGPNKWGYDVFSLQAVGNYGKNPVYRPGGCEFVEKGGKTGNQMLNNK